LTPLAARLLPELTAGFERLGTVARALRQAGDTVPVRIATLPAVAQLWLGPRLTALQAAAPEAELSVHALDTKPELTHGAFDLTLYPETPDERGQPGQVLARNALTPVAAPSWTRTVKRPEDLQGAVLLHDLAWRGDWQRWLAANGVAGIDPRRGPTYSLYSLAVERCIAGDGILIGHTALLQAPLGDGRLVQLFPDRALDGDPISLATPEPGRIPEALARIIACLRAGADTPDESGSIGGQD
jgi:LysR family glycine cleavage system transcriptional activator